MIFWSYSNFSIKAVKFSEFVVGLDFRSLMNCLRRWSF